MAALFDPEARGRITPLGNFTGALDSIEYFYGLAPSPQTNPSGLGFFEAEVVEFTSGCPEVASSLVYLKAGPVNNVTGGLIPGSNVTILKQVSTVYCLPTSPKSGSVMVLIEEPTRTDGFLEV